jgi:hypothetical protein
MARRCASPRARRRLFCRWHDRKTSGPSCARPASVGARSRALRLLRQVRQVRAPPLLGARALVGGRHMGGGRLRLNLRGACRADGVLDGPGLAHGLDGPSLLLPACRHRHRRPARRCWRSPRAAGLDMHRRRSRWVHSIPRPAPGFRVTTSSLLEPRAMADASLARRRAQSAGKSPIVTPGDRSSWPVHSCAAGRRGPGRRRGDVLADGGRRLPLPSGPWRDVDGPGRWPTIRGG